MFLTPQVVVEYGNRTREHQSGHQSSYWLWTSVLNFSDLMRTGVTHSPPHPQNNIGQDRKDKKQDNTRKDKTGQDKTGQDRTKQDKIGKDRTRQDQTGTRHNKTGQNVLK